MQIVYRIDVYANNISDEIEELLKKKVKFIEDDDGQ
jgi:hypothetical protein